jgi:hypothetical protein
MNYSFPATKWVKTATRNNQKDKIIDEGREFQLTKDGSEHEIEEAIDIFQSLETYFRILERNGVNVDGHMFNVQMKNTARGYYD